MTLEWQILLTPHKLGDGCSHSGHCDILHQRGQKCTEAGPSYHATLCGETCCRSALAVTNVATAGSFWCTGGLVVVEFLKVIKERLT